FSGIGLLEIRRILTLTASQDDRRCSHGFRRSKRQDEIPDTRVLNIHMKLHRFQNTGVINAKCDACRAEIRERDTALCGRNRAGIALILWREIKGAPRINSSIPIPWAMTVGIVVSAYRVNPGTRLTNDVTHFIPAKVGVISNDQRRY